MSSMKNFKYELPHEPPNDKRLKILGNKEILQKSKNCLGIKPRV